MLFLNDTLCRINGDGSFEFGKVLIPRKDDGVPLPSFDLKRTVPVVWTNGDTEIIDTLENNGHIGIVSRKFRPGDRIKSLDNGKTGHITGVQEFVTLQCAANPKVIYKDIPQDRLVTIMKFYGYPGEHILYQGWIGMVLKATKRITYSHNDDFFFSLTDRSENASQVPPWMDPYSVSDTDDSLLHPGQQITFTKKMWQQGKFDAVWGRAKSLLLVGQVFVVDNIEIIGVVVQWLCPADATRQDENALNSKEVPTKIIDGELLNRIEKLNFLSYLPATNGSGRIFEVTEEDIPITEKDWLIGFTKKVFPHQMNIIFSSSGSGDEPEKKKLKSDNENISDPDPAAAIGKTDEKKEKLLLPYVVKVLHSRQVVTVVFDVRYKDNTSGHLDSLTCIPFVTMKKDENDFVFPFGCWVKRKKVQLDADADNSYGIVVDIISASKCIVQWANPMEKDSPERFEECWNLDLLRHEKFNSFCGGGMVLWDIWQCGVILDNRCLCLKVVVQSFRGEILMIEPHKLHAIEYHGFWDVLRQKWLIRDFECYLNEVRMNPYEQSEETFTKRVLVFDNVPSTHTYYTVETPYEDGHPFAATVLREILFLQQHLPDGIWVQFYFDRIDLVSAVIRGAKGTPYEAGLFFFDIKIPIMYPAVPPQVRFVPFGETTEINPNFDAKGYICSSLLETVPDGCYTERWTTNSNLVQILLSIQGLYLCEHPLFNKPAYSLLPSYQLSSHSKSKMDLELSRRYNKKICGNLVLYYAKVFKSPPYHWRFLLISHYFEMLECLVKKMKDAEVIPKTFGISSNSKDTFDENKFSPEIEDATIHFELILHDIKENKWQLFPRL